MKIAFATQDHKHVDAHFGWAEHIAIYDVSPSGHRYLETRAFAGDLAEEIALEPQALEKWWRDLSAAAQAA